MDGVIAAKCTEVKIEDVMCYTYTPVTSVAVEGAFSHLIYVLSDRRNSLTPDNLRKMLVIMNYLGKL